LCFAGTWTHCPARQRGRNAAAKANATHETLISNRALGSDVHTFLYHAVLSSWQDEGADHHFLGALFDMLGDYGHSVSDVLAS
jgi:hypothetical protein